VGATYTAPVTFVSFDRVTAHTHEPIFAHNSSRGLVLGRPLRDETCLVMKFGGVYPKTPLKWSEWSITSQNKMSNNFETVRGTRNMSMNHDYETGVALTDSVNKTVRNAP